MNDTISKSIKEFGVDKTAKILYNMVIYHPFLKEFKEKIEREMPSEIKTAYEVINNG